jgi:Kef-type K+ transport system membrane component KefB
VFMADHGGVPWSVAGVATGVAILGKILGTYVGARLDGHPPGVALRLGALLNTRGLTELVVLQAGYSAGILTAGLFLALVVMALFTTAMTGPTYQFVTSWTRRRPSRSAPTWSTPHRDDG